MQRKLVQREIIEFTYDDDHFHIPIKPNKGLRIRTWKQPWQSF